MAGAVGAALVVYDQGVLLLHLDQTAGELGQELRGQRDREVAALAVLARGVPGSPKLILAEIDPVVGSLLAGLGDRRDHGFAVEHGVRDRAPERAVFLLGEVSNNSHGTVPFLSCGRPHHAASTARQSRRRPDRVNNPSGLGILKRRFGAAPRGMPRS